MIIYCYVSLVFHIVFFSLVVIIGFDDFPSITKLEQDKSNLKLNSELKVSSSHMHFATRFLRHVDYDDDQKTFMLFLILYFFIRKLTFNTT